jgi:hypothetical protein
MDASQPLPERYRSRTYFVPCHSYGPGPQRDERDMLQEVVALLAERPDTPGYIIERREVGPGSHGSLCTDEPKATYSRDGNRPSEFERVARLLEETIGRLQGAHVFLDSDGQRVTRERGERGLGSARASSPTCAHTPTSSRRRSRRPRARSSCTLPSRSRSMADGATYTVHLVATLTHTGGREPSWQRAADALAASMRGETIAVGRSKLLVERLDVDSVAD